MTFDEWTIYLDRKEDSGEVDNVISLRSLLNDWRIERDKFQEKLEYLGCIDYEKYKAKHPWIIAGLHE